MDVPVDNPVRAAVRCPICSSGQHDRVPTPVAGGGVPAAVYRCANCRVYFLAPAGAPYYA